MTKFKILVFKVRRNFFSILFLVFVGCLILFSSSNIQAAKSGLKLWANSIIPSLLPFFIATELLSYTNAPLIFEKIFTPIMKPLFNISGKGSYALFMGWLSGYPIGAKIAVNFRKNNICSKNECEKLLSFTNNSGPLFIVGSIGITLFGNTLIGTLLLITHLLGSLTVGILFRFWHTKNSNNNNLYSVSIHDNKLQVINFSNLGEILSKSVYSAISSILMIGGFVVLFSVIISILNNSGFLNIVTIFFKPISTKLGIPDILISNIFNGILEVTNGINLISNVKIKNISINIILTAFLLGFGGICVLFQVLSIVSKSDLSIKPYILGKILHGLFSSLYTFIFIQIFPIFNFNL